VAKGLVTGGWLADTAGGLSVAYLAGGFVASISLLYFAKVAVPHFENNKLR
jgi:hypothetical protein